MHTWTRRIRAAIGMGLIWGATWALAGGLLARAPGFESDLPFALLFAPLGFISGVIFSGVLVAAARRRAFRSVSLARFAAWGAASGLLLSGMFVVGAALRGASAWGEFVVFGPALAAASAFCATSSLALSRRAERLQLGEDTDNPRESNLIDRGKRELSASDE